jgi:glutaredoxin
VQVLLLTTESCHFCDHAKAVLARVSEEYQLEVSELSIASPEGRGLAERDGILILPGIYVDGELFGYGRLSEGKLKRRFRDQRI